MSNTITPASVSQSGNYGASIDFSSYFLLENVRQMNFRRKLTQPFHQDMKAIMGDEGPVQSSNTYPFILCTDLSKSSGASGGGTGDQITIDKLGRYVANPIMGDVLVKNANQPLNWSRDAVLIDLYNMPPLNAGGLITQQRTPHDEEIAMMITASTWFNDLEDNITTCIICGGRGYDTTSGWQLPVEGDPKLAAMLVNPMQPPTLNRYFQPGGGTSLSTIPTTAVITLQFFDYLATAITNSPLPLMGVRMTDDKTGYQIGTGQTPIYIVGVTKEQYNTLRTQAIGTGDWNTFVSLTGIRADFTKHPLFRDPEIGLWRNMLFFVYGRPITYPQGSTASEYTDATSTTTRTVTVAQRAQRGFILGAQALAIAFGNANPRKSGKIARSGGESSDQGLPYFWHIEIEEGSIPLCYAKAMFGIKKLRYPYQGVTYDANVAVFDTYQAFNSQFSPV
jgi:hypothetical protein